MSSWDMYKEDRKGIRQSIRLQHFPKEMRKGLKSLLLFISNECYVGF
jgi:hypothetical protein